MYVEIVNFLVNGNKVAPKSLPSRFWCYIALYHCYKYSVHNIKNANLKIYYEKYVHKLMTTLGFLEAIFMILHITFGNELIFKIVIEFMLNWRAPSKRKLNQPN
jgi:hypothetical protein